MLHMMIRLLLLVQLIAWASPADAQQRFTQNPISLQRAAGADGDGSAITTKGYLSVALQVTGTFTATVNFEGTADASTWVALKCVNVATDGRVTTLTAAGMVQCNVQGMTSLRARVSDWSDGTVTVTGYLMDVVLGSTSGGSGGGGSGDASLAEQQTQTGHLADIETVTGATTDAEATAGGTGTVSAKLRNATALLDTLNTALSTLNAKLPSAGALADDTANPTTTGVAAYNMCSDGSTWDRCVKATAETTGVQIVRPHALLADRVSGVAGITDGSSTSVVAAQGASTRFCATTIVVSNSSATNVTVDIRDGTAGSVLMTIPAAANMGGGVIPLAVPLCTSANTIFAADPSASASTVTITAVGFKTTL